MSDIRIVNVSDIAGIWTDWLLKPTGALDESDELANIVKVALMTDRLASVDEVLPDPDNDDRRGWWGDLDATVIWDGWPIGCKNWLLTRAKITGAEAQEGSTLARAEEYTRDALRPLIERRICSSIDVVAERIDLHRIDVVVTIFRGPNREIEMRFQNLWNEVRET